MLVVVAFVVSLLVAVSAARTEGDPKIDVLGAGTGLSLLVSSGDARIVIANGDDGVAFGNAISRATRLFGRRIDLLVIAGDETSLPVANRAARDLRARETLVMAGSLERHLTELGLDGSALVRQETRITIDALEIHLYPEASTWGVSITHGEATVVAGALGAAGSASRSAAVTILDGNIDDATLASLPGEGLVVSTRAASARKLRQAAGAGTRVRWIARIEPGDFATVRITDRGIIMPGSTTELVPMALTSTP